MGNKCVNSIKGVKLSICTDWGDAVIRREIAEIIQKYNNILVLNASISGKGLESAWRDFLADFATKELEISKVHNC